MNKPYFKKEKEEIRADYSILFRKPVYLLIIPLLFFHSAYNRLKYSSTSIYLTKTCIDKTLIDTADIRNLKVVMTSASFKNLAAFRASEDPTISLTQYLKIIEKRFSRGDRCLILLNTNEVPVSYLFVSEKVIDIPEVNLCRSLTNAEASIFDVYTFSTSRGKGYHQQLFQKSYSYLSQCSIDNVYLWLMKHNKASIKAHLKVGFRYVLCKYTFSKVLGFGFRTKKKDVHLLEELLES